MNVHMVDLFMFIFYSHRVCYRMSVTDCTDEDEYGEFSYFDCRLFVSGKGLKSTLKLKPLLVTGGNHSSVFIDSVPGTESKSVCFYNVSVSNDSTSNCSSVRLEHQADHPTSEYVNHITQPDSDSSTNNIVSECKSYVKVFYEDSQGVQQHETLCGEELATMTSWVKPVTSLFLVYWTNNDNNPNSSFHLRAQCVE